MYFLRTHTLVKTGLEFQKYLNIDNITPEVVVFCFVKYAF